MARPKKKPDMEIIDTAGKSVDTNAAMQELIDEIAELKREKSERSTAAPQTAGNDAAAALLQLLTKGVSIQPADPSYAAFKSKLNQKFTLTDQRKAEIEAIITEAGAGKLQYMWDKDAPSITIRRNIFRRVFDKDTEAYVKMEAVISESVHASQDDRTFRYRIKEMLSIKSAK